MRRYIYNKEVAISKSDDGYKLEIEDCNFSFFDIANLIFAMHEIQEELNFLIPIAAFQAANEELIKYFVDIGTNVTVCTNTLAIILRDLITQPIVMYTNNNELTLSFYNSEGYLSVKVTKDSYFIEVYETLDNKDADIVMIVNVNEKCYDRIVNFINKWCED